MSISQQISLKQLRYFSRIVECGSISKASQDLNVAQTALGLQVRSLEESLGTTLLLRHPKGVKPTTMGQLVYDSSSKITDLINTMVSSVSNKSKVPFRDVWLGLTANLINAIGMQAIVLQEKCIPGFRLHLSERSYPGLLAGVLKGDLDWAIVHDAEEIEGCRSVPILRQKIVLVSKSGSGVPVGPVKFTEVLKLGLVLDSGRRVISKLVTKASHSLGLKPKIKFEIDSLSTSIQLILNEDVYGVGSQAVFQESINQGTLVAHPIIEPSLEMTAYFVTRLKDPVSERDLPILKFLDELICTYCKENPDEWIQLVRIADSCLDHK
jgi:LysR family transcriptional regulator, nitrogen assimilation regulatory protein